MTTPDPAVGASATTAKAYPKLRATKEGKLAFLIPGAGKECFTYFKIFGDVKDAGKVPCVLVHGGPGLSGDYMLSYLPLYEKFGIPLVLYDQIGNGESTHLPEKNGDEEFWKEDLFHAELANLTKGLGLDDRGYDLLGHSWGGMMGSTFAGKQPKGLRRLVLSNSPASLTPWHDAYHEYRSQLSQELQNTLQRHEDAGTTGSEEYQNIMLNDFYAKHLCHVVPWPEELSKSFEWATKDPTVVLTMDGPNEWETIGSQRNWSAVESLKTIIVPTLVINGTAEGATDEAVRPFVEQITSAKWVKLNHSSHMPMYEEPEKYFAVLKDFLQGN